MSTRFSGVPNGPELEGFELEADLIRVLANPKRLRIVDLLGEGPNTVTEIAERLELSLQNTSQHLRIMRDRGIVRAQREGREVRYGLTSPVLSESCRIVRRALLEEPTSRPVRFAAKRSPADGRGSSRYLEANRARRPIMVTG